jgi:GDPmannose 4,6-dehydratase
MSPRSALITGITGQDGMHLSEVLLERDYDVYGLIRGQNNPKREAFEAEFPHVQLIEGDLMDQSSLSRALKQARPSEVYNLGAISHVGHSFKSPQLTADVTGKGFLNLLEAVRAQDEPTRVYQASTSEMFGGLDYNRPPLGYDEDSAFHPRSPYGVAKLYAYWIGRNYRESYDTFVTNGILFNHEGPRRGREFLTRKVTDGVAKIALGLQDAIELGNLDAKRDWGYAGDYVEGMWRMMQQPEPEDFVLASGETHSVREFCQLAFAHVGIEIEWQGDGEEEEAITTDGHRVVSINPEFYRPAEVDLLLGNPAKAERVLGWVRKTDFPALVAMMVDHDMSIQSKRLTGANN